MSYVLPMQPPRRRADALKVRDDALRRHRYKERAAKRRTCGALLWARMRLALRALRGEFGW